MMRRAAAITAHNDSVIRGGPFQDVRVGCAHQPNVLGPHQVQIRQPLDQAADDCTG